MDWLGVEVVAHYWGSLMVKRRNSHVFKQGNHKGSTVEVYLTGLLCWKAIAGT